jgi:RimJ/RimL family protein N-acetyltransferase
VIATRVRLRAASADDAARLLRWRNDPETRRASFTEAEVRPADHERWLADTLARADRRLYVALAGDEEVATARLDLEGAEAEVSITVAPEWRGRGLATAVLRALADEAFGRLALSRLVARVKGSNPASRAVFERAGFHRIADGGATADVTTLVRERPGARTP